MMFFDISFNVRRFVTRLTCLVLWLAASSEQPSAMTFSVVSSQSASGNNFVIGNGPIEIGDADRFEAAISGQAINSRVLMVTSPGGNVGAALRLASAIKANSFVVVGHKECASACAQILFPAGEYSVLTPGSVLGIHSCSAADARDNLCNEQIANFAVSNGFPYGTLDMFSDLYGPGEMKWMTEISARCFGFYRDFDDPKPIEGGRKACVDGVIYTMGSDVPRRPFGPSFNCDKAVTNIEQLFCLDKELMQADSILGLVYDAALKVSGSNRKLGLRSEQRKWIEKRNSVCNRYLTRSLDFRQTREAALCLYKFNENRIYELLPDIN